MTYAKVPVQVFSGRTRHPKRTVTISVGLDHAGPQAWKGVRVLVTGASGFIGSHLVSRLTGSGAEVHVVSRRPRPGPEGPAWHVADLTDAAACVELVGTVAPDVVFHLASAVTGARDVDLVVPLMAANQAAAVNLLTAVAKSAPTPGWCWPDRSRSRMKASDLTPHSPYAAAKWAASAYARMFSALWDVRVSVLQIAMVYGPAPARRHQARAICDAGVVCAATHRSCRVGHAWSIGCIWTTSLMFSSARPRPTRRSARFSTSAVGGWCPSATPWSCSPRSSEARRDRSSALLLIVRWTLPAAATHDVAELLDWRPSTALEDGLRKTVKWYAENVAVPAREPVHALSAI